MPLPYFGAPLSTLVNGWLSFQTELLGFARTDPGPTDPFPQSLGLPRQGRAHFSIAAGTVCPVGIHPQYPKIVSAHPRLSKMRRPLSCQMNWLTCGLELCRHPYQVGKGIRFHLLHDLPPMSLHRDLADAKFSADLFVQ